MKIHHYTDRGNMEINLDINAIDDWETVSILREAIESDNLTLLARLIELGLDIDAIDEHGKTALMWAVEFDQAEALSMLISAGAIPVSVSELEKNSIQSGEVLKQLMLAGEDLSDRTIGSSIRSLLTKVDSPDEWELDPQYYQADKHPRFGLHNPEKIDAPFWREMVKFRQWAYAMRLLDEDECCEAIWCFSRYGQSITPLPDGRVIEIAGEHEDSYDPDFCIYNDVVVYDGKGDFQIYGYPKDVFPPTDFHTATLVDNWIYIIGSIGYMDERILGETPVYRLNCTTFEIEKVTTTGECPGWISEHWAVLINEQQISIGGGQVLQIDGYIDNLDEYILDLDRCHWERQVEEDKDRGWQELKNLLPVTSAKLSIERLTSLRRLDLSNKQLTVFPEIISNLTALRQLDLHYNEITMLPETIGNLTMLQSLNLCVNKIAVFPEIISNLTALKQLDLSCNEITVLPETIGNLTMLQSLNLCGNTIAIFPEIISNLTALRQLNLCGNEITVLPETIGNLTMLQSLNLRGNKIATLPKEIWKLTALQSLDLRDNEITVLSDKIRNLTALEYLDLSSNKITLLPEEIGELKMVKFLHLGDNNIPMLPEEIGNLTTLQYLYLGMTVLPKSICNLTNLKRLILDCNPIDYIPE